MDFIPKDIEEYCLAHSASESDFFQRLSDETYQKEEVPKMLSGPMVGNFLQLLVRVIQPKLVLDIGTFTGYSALKLAEAGLDMFVEKPLSHNMKDVYRLCKMIKREKIISLMGCNLRFNKALQEVKYLIEHNTIGKILSVKAECGTYLPSWHPYENYSKGYSARDDLGGGVVLTCIHEIDYLYWFFGKWIFL